MNISDAKNILIVKFGSLGDCYQTIPTIFSLYHYLQSKHSNDMRITLITQPEFENLFNNCPWIDRVIPLERPSSRNFIKIRQIAQFILDFEFDCVLDLQLNRLSQRISKRLTNSSVLTISNTPHAKISLEQPEGMQRSGTDQLNALMTLLEIPAKPFMPSDLGWLAGAQNSFEWLELQRKVLLAVGASNGKGSRKSWPARCYAELSDILLLNGFTPVLVGNEFETAIGQKIEAKARKVDDMIGKTNLEGVSQLMNESVAIIGNDTGLMHLAPLLNVPSVTLFGHQTRPELHAAKGKFATHIQVDILENLDPTRVFDRMMDVYSYRTRLRLASLKARKSKPMQNDDEPHAPLETKDNAGTHRFLDVSHFDRNNKDPILLDD